MTSLFTEVSPEPTSDAAVRRITVSINGNQHTVDVEPRLLLVHLIRQGLDLTGTHVGCDTTHCGACTVLFDGAPGKELHDVRRAGRRTRDHNGRRPRGRPASCIPSRRHSRTSTVCSADSALLG